MRYPEPFIARLRDQIEISSVIGAHVPLKKKGREYMACCPFHKEKTPSFTVNDQKGFYHCFGCGAHGNAYDFLMKIENLSFPEAVEKIADHLGVPLPKLDRTERPKHVDHILEIHKKALAFYQKAFISSLGAHARTYSEKRQLTPETVQRFQLGYAPSHSQSLYRFLTQENFSPDSIQKSGLVVFPENRSPYDKFRNRLMFPILNIQDKPIAFGGRLLETGEPKYLNSPETDIFKKGEELYNLNQAKRVSGNDPLVIVEGYMDVIALAQQGYPKAVAPLGTALTELHIQKAWRFCKVPVLCFDGDRAGNAASLRAAERILPHLKPGCSLSFAFLPKGFDPDTFVMEKGIEAFRALITEKAHALVDILWHNLLDQANTQTPEGKALLKDQMARTTSQIQDPTLKNLYQQDFKDRFFKLLYKKSTPTRSPLKKWSGTPHLQERILMRLLTHVPEVLEDLEESLIGLPLKDSTLSLLKDAIFTYYYDNKPLEREPLRTHLVGIGFGESLAMVDEDSIGIHTPFLEEGQKSPCVEEGKRIVEFLQKKETETLLGEAKKDFKESFDASAWTRFRALKKTSNKDD